MPVSVNISLSRPMLIIAGGASQRGISFAKKNPAMQFGQIKQIWTGSAYTENQFCMFDFTNAEVIIIASVQYFLVADTSISIIETALS